jgi:hypothetical protein
LDKQKHDLDFLIDKNCCFYHIIGLPVKNDKKYHYFDVSLRTAYANELSLDKKQTSYDDLMDALRLSLKGYNIK